MLINTHAAPVADPVYGRCMNVYCLHRAASDAAGARRALPAFGEFDAGARTRRLHAGIIGGGGVMAALGAFHAAFYAVIAGKDAAPLNCFLGGDATGYARLSQQ